MTNPLRSTDFDYLGVSNTIANERHSDAAGQPTKTKSYSIDAYGNRLSLTVTPTGGNPSTYTYGYDPQGSVSLLVDTASNLPKAVYHYDPYGNEDPNLTRGDQVANPNDPNGIDPTNPYRFDGKRYDSGAADLDMGVRRFGLDTSRFLQQDFFAGSLDDLDLATDPLTMNRYALAGANPIGFVELDGHMVGKIGGAGGSINGPAPGLKMRKPWRRCSTGGCYRPVRQQAEEHHESFVSGVLSGAGNEIASQASSSFHYAVHQVTHPLDTSNPCSFINSPGPPSLGCIRAVGVNAVKSSIQTGEDIASGDPRREGRAGVVLGSLVALKGAGRAATAVGGAEAAGAAAEGTTIYRAVGPNELSDIRNVGRYRVRPGGVEGKYFFERPEQASNFARMAGDKPYTTTSVRVSPSELARADLIDPVREGRAYFFRTPFVPAGPVTIFNYSVLP
jgi:RHS repeat-associated protein